VPAYLYLAQDRRDPWTPDLAAATKAETAAIELSTPVTDSSGETTFTVDASVAGDLFYVSPILDPAGVIANGWLKSGGLGTSPFMCLHIPTANAPGATSGIDVMIGIVDGSAPLLEQWVAGGARYNDIGGPRPVTRAHDIAAAQFNVVAGGIYSCFELAASPSTVAPGVYWRLGRVALGTDSKGGTGEAQQVQPNDDCAKAPHFVVLIRSAGTGPASVSFRATAEYQALHVKSA